MVAMVMVAKEAVRALMEAAWERVAMRTRTEGIHPSLYVCCDLHQGRNDAGDLCGGADATAWLCAIGNGRLGHVVFAENRSCPLNGSACLRAEPASGKMPMIAIWDSKVSVLGTASPNVGTWTRTAHPRWHTRPNMRGRHHRQCRQRRRRCKEPADRYEVLGSHRAGVHGDNDGATGMTRCGGSHGQRWPTNINTGIVAVVSVADLRCAYRDDCLPSVAGRCDTAEPRGGGVCVCWVAWSIAQRYSRRGTT